MLSSDLNKSKMKESLSHVVIKGGVRQRKALTGEREEQENISHI